MVRSGEQLSRRRFLHDPTGVHRQHPVGHLGDHAEIVGDEHDRRAVLTLEAGEQVEELGLHGDVERGRRLVGDEQLGAQGQRHRQHDPLTHPAGELVRVVVDPASRIRDADLLEQVDSPTPDGLSAGRLVGADGLTDLPADGVLRVQARERILEHHGDACAANLAHRLGCEGEQVAVVESHRPADPGPAHELEDGLGADRLARSGLADDADGLTGGDVEGHAADRVDIPVLGRKGHRQVAHREQRAGRHQAHLPGDELAIVHGRSL